MGVNPFGEQRNIVAVCGQQRQILYPGEEPIKRYSMLSGEVVSYIVGQPFSTFLPQRNS